MDGYLLLKNGETFTGKWLGHIPEQRAQGEVIFYTGMTGYQEVLTDPSYKGQIVVFTYPLIGNCGINDFDFESNAPQVAGVILSECSPVGYHYEARQSVIDYLQKWQIPILAHVDTRAVVKRIRNWGTMEGALTCSPVQANLENFFVSVEDKMLVKDVTIKEITTIGSGEYHVVLLDFGYKKSLVDSLQKAKCKVTVVPYDTPVEKIHSLKPDGIILSNGPGNPLQLQQLLPAIHAIVTSYPTLAICLGHLLLTMAFGGKTTKLKFGHRGGNQPVVDTKTNSVYMTSQNHSYVIDEQSLAKTGLSIRYKNINDGTVEGVAHPTLPITSVQFYPEASPGPVDTSWLLKEFVATMKTRREDIVYA